MYATPTPDSGRNSPRCRPCAYEMSLETAQKRAYASNCFTQLLAEYNREVGQGEPGVLGERAISFLQDMVQVAREDTVAIEVLCLALLLKPRKQNSRMDSPGIDLLQQALLEQASAKTSFMFHEHDGVHRSTSCAEIFVFR